ncbi:MAG: LysE family transporter [Candidatus Buchananbacteria bacterium]
MTILSEIFSIFILGLIGGANPGPLIISCCSESLRLGFIKSLKTIVWGLIAESAVAIVVLVLIFNLNPPAQIFYFIGLCGGLFLIYLAYQVSKINSISEQGARLFTFKKILILTVLNGSFWLFWLTICIPLAFEANKILPFGQWLFLLIFEFGWLVATVAIVFIFSRFRKILNNKKVIKIVYSFMALILLYFAVKMILSSSINLWLLYGK